jgi:hypothetical protein
MSKNEPESDFKNRRWSVRDRDRQTEERKIGTRTGGWSGEGAEGSSNWGEGGLTPPLIPLPLLLLVLAVS